MIDGAISEGSHASVASGFRIGRRIDAACAIHEGAIFAQRGLPQPNWRSMYDIVKHAVQSPRRALSATAVIAKSNSRRPSAAGPSANARPTAVTGSRAAEPKRAAGRIAQTFHKHADITRVARLSNSLGQRKRHQRVAGADSLRTTPDSARALWRLPAIFFERSRNLSSPFSV